MIQSSHPLEPNITQGDARFGRIVEAIAQIVGCADGEGKVTYFNQQWYKLTGLDRSQSLGLNFIKAIHPQQRQAVSQSWLAAIERQTIWEYEFKIIHQNKNIIQNIPQKYYWYAASAQPCFDSQGQLIEWVIVLNNIDKYKLIENKLENRNKFCHNLSQLADGAIACDKHGNPIFNAAGELGALLTMQDISDRQQQQAQTEIQQYFERLTLALDAAKMGSWYWDSFTNKNLWTPYHDVIFGYEPGNGEHTYEDWASRVHPEDLPLAEAAWETALREHKDYVCEYRIILPDGTLRWVESYGRYYYDDENKASRMAGTVTDITERKKAQQALEESERRYSTLAQISPVGIYRCDASVNLLYVNQRWCEITGYSFEQVINQGWRATVHPEDKARIEAQVKRTIEQKIPFECEFRFQRPDDSVVWVFAQSVPEMDRDGSLIGYVGTVTDITHKKTSEKALILSEERFRSTFEQAAVGISHADKNGNFIRVNQKLCDILGYSREELLQLSFQEITYANDLQSDLKQVCDLLAGKIQNFSMEKRYICKGGAVIWVELTVSLVRQTNGESDYFLGVIKDISQRKQAQNQLQLRAQELEQVNILLTQTTAQLRKRNSELDQFAYVASHDLKAPLRAIANLSQWLEDDLLGVLQPDNQRHLELLRQRVYRMEALINGLLQYSRVGRVDNAEELLDVGKLLEEIIDDFLPSKNFTIEVEHPMPVFTTKGMMLRRVFSNLIDNAITHHDGKEGYIKISVEDKGQFYEFAVSDDGPGISSEYHDKIFVIFQTLEARDKKESMGVGLSIVKKIIETEGTTITVDSEVGRGATFRFTWHK